MFDGMEGVWHICTPVATARQLLHSVVGGYAGGRNGWWDLTERRYGDENNGDI